MQTGVIAVVFGGACLLTVLFFVSYRRLLGERERGGCLAMGAFVLGWLSLLTALITGGFLLSVRLTTHVQ
jgi:hypothetical protein